MRYRRQDIFHLFSCTDAVDDTVEYTDNNRNYEAQSSDKEKTGESMRLRNIPEAAEIVKNSPYVIHDAVERKGHWKDGNEKPLFLEIGMGKGRFLIESALAHPENEYLGMERYESVLFRACERMEGKAYRTPLDEAEYQSLPEEERILETPENLHFLDMDAKELPEIFAPEEIDRIYLNFSDPWPKARHAKRRLTSHQFLAVYEQVLKNGGTLEFKTDNVDLFDFSVEEIQNADLWELRYATHDLHHDPVLNRGNIMTEYERKFSQKGNPICKLEAVYRKA